MYSNHKEHTQNLPLQQQEQNKNIKNIVYNFITKFLFCPLSAILTSLSFSVSFYIFLAQTWHIKTQSSFIREHQIQETRHQKTIHREQESKTILSWGYLFFTRTSWEKYFIWRTIFPRCILPKFDSSTFTERFKQSLKKKIVKYMCI